MPAEFTSCKLRRSLHIVYLLCFPNEEVHESFLSQLLSTYTENNDSDSILSDLTGALEDGKTTALVIETITSILASIPYPTVTNEHMFQSIIGLVFFLERPSMVQAEVHTSEGRIDMVLRTEKHLYVIEFKMDESAETAIEQIKSMEYFRRFLAEKGKVQIHLLGISMSSKKRNITGWKEETPFN